MVFQCFLIHGFHYIKQGSVLFVFLMSNISSKDVFMHLNKSKFALENIGSDLYYAFKVNLS